MFYIVLIRYNSVVVIAINCQITSPSEYHHQLCYVNDRYIFIMRPRYLFFHIIGTLATVMKVNKRLQMLQRALGSRNGRKFATHRHASLSASASSISINLSN